MATNFPGGFDLFLEPTIPEDTPLSSAGSGNLNHTEHHRNLGDAVESLQHNVALKTHDHSGEDDRFHGPKLKQANTHEEVDTDLGPTSHHHTLGSGPYQAAAGNHIHDYNGNTILNKPFVVCTSTTRPGAPQVGTTIYETDRKCFRIWDTYGPNQAVIGLNSTDQFDRTSTTDIGSTLYDISYDLAPSGFGKLATPSGNSLSWIDGGAQTNRAICRRIKSEDKETETDDQIITWKTGSQVTEAELPLTEGGLNDFYFRMSADKQHYWRLSVGDNYVKVWFTTEGKDNEQFLGELHDVDLNLPNIECQAMLIDRTITVYRTGENMGAVKDTKAQTSKGASFRGWGVGAVAGARVLGQTTPAEIDYVRIQDNIYWTTTSRWTLLPIAATPVCRVRQGKTQKLSTTGTILEWIEELEDNFNYFDKNASQTDFIIREPGLYRIEVALQWDPQFVPDVGHVVLMVNGLQTTVRDSKFMRGNLFTPGFSQTLSLSAPVRFSENDILQVKAMFTVSNSLLDLINTAWDAPSKVNSRIDITYVGP